MEKVLPISLKLNFTLNTLGCYGLNVFVIKTCGFTVRLELFGFVGIWFDQFTVSLDLPTSSLVRCS